jgi:predicted metallo-beta-lactamase superfamily hydrolase
MSQQKKKMEKFLSCTQEKLHDTTYAQKSKWVLQSIVVELSVTVFKANQIYNIFNNVTLPASPQHKKKQVVTKPLFMS